MVNVHLSPLHYLGNIPAYRRLSARLGFQGKLVACFIILLSTGLFTSTVLFNSETSDRVSQLLGEQAQQLSLAVSGVAKPAMAELRRTELTAMGQDLIKSRNILYVTFLDTHLKPIASASRDPDFMAGKFSQTHAQSRETLHVIHRSSPALGQYVQVVTPIVDTGQLLGYVAVGISESREQLAIRYASLHVVVFSLAIVGISLPLAWALVHRIFLPIRELEKATRKIAAGDLTIQVATDRTDLIGRLARSFNEMVFVVRTQQHALELANAELEMKVVERTAQLEETNARLTREIAEKEDFLRAVSHDLNAPLRNIAGMATMLLAKHKAKFDEDIIHRLERIRKNVEVETDLIGELLELSRIKTRRQKLEPVEIAPLLSEITDVFEEDLRAREIQIVVDSAMPVLTCERARIRQVFQNLIDNAIKYMGDGRTREIHVGCDVTEIAAEFYVSDTGIGIHADDLDKVFFIFRRGKSSQTQNIAGKGVGLSSVKSIIETYGGTIRVESELGKGSTFRFTIPGPHVGSAVRTVTQFGPHGGPYEEISVV
jgi:signal transduction histidine kinase